MVEAQNITAPAVDDLPLIKQGNYFVLVDNAGNRRVMKAQKGETVSHYKYEIDLTIVLDQPYGTFFKLQDDGKYTKFDKFEDIGLLETYFAGGDNEEEAMEEFSEDNRNIKVGVHDAQKISYGDIEQMKAEGKSGSEVI
jgi:hypothetical protein